MKFLLMSLFMLATSIPLPNDQEAHSIAGIFNGKEGQDYVFKINDTIVIRFQDISPEVKAQVDLDQPRYMNQIFGITFQKTENEEGAVIKRTITGLQMIQ